MSGEILLDAPDVNKTEREKQRAALLPAGGVSGPAKAVARARERRML